MLDSVPDTGYAEPETQLIPAQAVRKLPVRRWVTVIVPAHNEAEYIGRTIESLQGQRRRPDSIIVMCDNCDDGTQEVAARYEGVIVMESVNNTHLKSGALNQALDVATRTMDPDDFVVCMDADTIIDHELIYNALQHFAEEGDRLAAVSSNHLISEFDTHKYIQLMQAMEYERDRRFVGRRKGRYGCMTGMAAMYRVRALYDVKEHYGTFYDEDNWTEDWFLTMALKHLGWKMIRPQDCMAATVPVPTIRGLVTQRIRWARGYLQTLRKFGFTRWTAIPWLKQLGLLWSTAARLLFFYLLFLSRHHLLAWWMLPVFVLFIADAVNTSHRVGWRAVVAAICFPSEIFYSWLITMAIFTGYFRELFNVGSAHHFKRVRR
jgi:cellulose synthase/poly-beta-1,6-N-acetylglucosamine synthase-like glycosyltransferase